MTEIFNEKIKVKLLLKDTSHLDYGFHGPTMSWPVPGTLMIEPTESESKIEKGTVDLNNNVI
ncbi:hypothetical protein M8C21_001859, partial [Ambrosia artemisiifolia]